MELPKYLQAFKAKINFSKHFEPYWPEHMIEAPEWDKEEYLELINFDKLVETCSSLRDGMPCKVVEEYFGFYNLIYDIEFEDGFRWVARVPLMHRLYQCEEDPELEEEVQMKLFESMLAAQTFARMKKSVFAPAIYASFLNRSNDVGIPYYLMQKLGDWRLDEVIGHKNEASLRIAFSDLAREMVSLASPPYFSQIGSLFAKEDEFHVGPVLCYTSLDDDPVQLDKRGPYSTVEEYFLAALNRHTSAALRDANRELYYQVTRLRQMLPCFVDQRFNNGPFILSPFDWDARHIFLSDDNTISGVVDWDYATVVPLQAFFRYPTFMMRDWAAGIKSPLMERYRTLFRECLAELQDETELPLLELLDKSRWFSLFDEAAQSSELGRKALPLLEKAVGMQVESKRVEIKAIPVVRGMPVLKDVGRGTRIGVTN
jgi:hypothetical protein